MEKTVSRRDLIAGTAAAGAIAASAALAPTALASADEPIANSEGAGDWLGEAPVIDPSENRRDP